MNSAVVNSRDYAVFDAIQAVRFIKLAYSSLVVSLMGVKLLIEMSLTGKRIRRRLSNITQRESVYYALINRTSRNAIYKTFSDNYPANNIVRVIVSFNRRV